MQVFFSVHALNQALECKLKETFYSLMSRPLFQNRLSVFETGPSILTHVSSITR